MCWFWPYFYHALVNKTIGNDDAAEKSILKAAEMIDPEFFDKIHKDTLKLLLKDDRIGQKCYDRLIQLLDSR